jgi:hypothetical protein
MSRNIIFVLMYHLHKPLDLIVNLASLKSIWGMQIYFVFKVAERMHFTHNSDIECSSELGIHVPPGVIWSLIKEYMKYISYIAKHRLKGPRKALDDQFYSPTSFSLWDKWILLKMPLYLMLVRYKFDCHWKGIHQVSLWDQRACQVKVQKC